MSLQKIESFLLKFAEECSDEEKGRSLGIHFKTDEMLENLELLSEVMGDEQLLTLFESILQDSALEEQDERIQNVYLKALNSYHRFQNKALN